jgi:hypothetical protein
MRTNKIAVLLMLLTIVLSIGIMSDVNTDKNDLNVTQISVGCYIMSANSESAGAEAAWSTGGSIAIGTAVATVGKCAVKGSIPAGWSPLGWGLAIGGLIL